MGVPTRRTAGRRRRRALPVVLLVLPAASVPASAGAAQTTLRPAAGPPGTEVVIAGSGFPRATVVMVGRGQVPATRRPGGFRAAFRVPAGARGALSITARAGTGRVQTTPETWRQHGIDPFTNFHPVSGLYSSDDPAQLRRQVRELRYGHQDAGIVSWSGVGSAGD